MNEAEPSAYRRPRPGAQPPWIDAGYRSTQRRGPTCATIRIEPSASELTGPRFADAGSSIADLTAGSTGTPVGERILVGGRVLDENGRPLQRALIEIWQCNAAGRYAHDEDRHDAPLDPNFSGVGRVFTDDTGRYRFKSIRPGAYPWRNHYNAWRPAHIHFSLFGPAFATRLVTQMYFPGDPLLDYDPIFNSVPDAKARGRLVADLDWEHCEAEYALAYRFDLVLRGARQTPWEP
jgi:protocatechuate 3,4-dioxygenase beta subunit